MARKKRKIKVKFSKHLTKTNVDVDFADNNDKKWHFKL